MVEFHFVKNPIALEILTSIIDLAGDNFNPPFDSLNQPSDGTARNSDDLLQYQLPGGTSMQGYSEPSISESMGSAVNSLMAVVAPFMSAFGLILPIIGVIRGIIDIICSLLNPWALIKAIIRLFNKWMPPFISLFPPLAGIIIILSTIKAIIALVFFILTTILPIIELIKYNIEVLKGLGDDASEEQREAGLEKLLGMLADILNQIGVLGAFKPILDIIFLILEMVSGLPCVPGTECEPNADLTGLAESAECDDTSCCDDDACPPVFSDPPKGRAIKSQTFFADSPPLSVWRITVRDDLDKMLELAPYMQSTKAQLDEQLDEEIDEAQSVGQPEPDFSHFRVKLTSPRGSGFSLTVPIIRYAGVFVDVFDSALTALPEEVNYEIVPNWEMLIKNNVVGLGCHPDVKAAKDLLQRRFPDMRPVLTKFPEANIRGPFLKMEGDLNTLLGRLSDCVNNLDAECADGVESDIIALLLDFVDDMKDRMNKILIGIVDRFNSGFEVDKNLAKAGGEDRAIITVTPRDATGTPILKNLPKGVDITVSLFTDFGIISNQKTNTNVGTVTADIKSLTAGTATITAKINDEYISDLIPGGEAIRTRAVQFVSDAVLPKRRFVSKPRPDSDKRSTISKPEREPGS